MAPVTWAAPVSSSEADRELARVFLAMFNKVGRESGCGVAWGSESESGEGPWV